MQKSDDEVVFETDVFFNQDLNGVLHLFQHPTVPAGVPARRVDAPVAARLREARCQWELEYSIDASNGNFDSRATADPRMRRMKHASSEVPLKTVNAIGVLDADGLHLSPVHSLQIIRPDISYLDPVDPKPVASTSETLQPVRMTAASLRPADPRRKKEPFMTQQQLDESDPWIPLTVHTADVRACVCV
jgi:hypothetical protein